MHSQHFKQSFGRLYGADAGPADVAYQPPGQSCENGARRRLVAEILDALARVHDTLMPANAALYELDGRLFGYECAPPSAMGEKAAPETEEAQISAFLQRLMSIAVDVQVKAQKLNGRI